jgi:hypothetical protein
LIDLVIVIGCSSISVRGYGEATEVTLQVAIVIVTRAIIRSYIRPEERAELTIERSTSRLLDDAYIEYLATLPVHCGQSGYTYA